MNDSTVGSAASAPGCSSRIPLVPIRYAVLPGDGKSAQYRYSGSGYELENGFPALREASYTLRALRPGYVYVFMSGPKGEKMVVHEHDGQGHYKELNYTGLENYHKRDAFRAGRSMSWVWADTCPDTASEVWIAYSTHLWTNRITTRICSDKSARAIHMQKVDMKELTSGEKSPSKQKHLLPAEGLGKWVEDYKPRDKRLPLGWSCHSIGDDLPLGTIIAEGKNYPITQPRVPAVVALFDPQGISIDLALIAAARKHQILDVQAKRTVDDQQEFPACMRLDVEKLAIGSADFHRKNLTATILEETLKLLSTTPAKDVERIVKQRSDWHRAQPRGHRVPGNDELAYQVLTDKNLSLGGERLAKRIDAAKYNEFLALRQKADQELKTLLAHFDVACTNHDGWLATAETEHKITAHSIAAALDLHDRDNKISAQGLEQSIAILMNGMGSPLPGRHDQDPRFKRLERWVSNDGSPIYIALAAYNPFKEKADAVGGLLGAKDQVIEELYGKFPAAVNSTDLIAQDVTTVVMKKLHGKTRWDRSQTLRQQVQAAAQEANAQKVMGLLSARYRITDTKVKLDALSIEVRNYLDRGMAEIQHSTEVVTTGSRTVTIKQTQTIRVRPTLKSLGVTSGGGVLNAGMLYFNMINLTIALEKLKKEPATSDVLNFVSAVLGTISAMAATGVSLRSIYVASAARFSQSLPGAAFGTGVTSTLSSKLFGRALGWPGIILGVITDGYSGYEKLNAGNSTAAAYTWGGGIALAIGSAAMLEGGIALGSAMAGVGTAAGASATIPVAGWIAAAVILIGGAMVIGAMWLMSRANKENHTPMELWAARSVFGNRKNDGQVRQGIKLDSQKRLPGYASLSDEIKGWYQGYFGPVLLDASQAKSLGWNGIDSAWHDNYFEADKAEFAVLFPGFVQDQSTWQGKLASRAPLPITDATTQCRHVKAGLILHFNHKIGATDSDRISLEVTYKPNQGWDETAVTTAAFELID